MKLHPQRTNPRRTLAFAALMLLLVLVGAFGLVTQRGETAVLRAELEALKLRQR